MTIDITKLKAGDEVQIANGDWFECACVDVSDFSIFVDKHDYFIPTAIITAHRPKFDWKDAKSGMCFKDKGENKYWFIGNDFSDDDYVIASEKKCEVTDIDLILLLKSDITRHPEGDVI